MMARVVSQAAIWNSFVEGDNLAVLAQLPAESADLIYIDPPYNTGNDFGYHDDFRAAPTRRTTKHTGWVDMMRPRLERARDVLSPQGALWVSIDDNEMAHLRVLLDEIFGEANYLATIVAQLNPKGRQLGGGFAGEHEYLLVYAKSARECALDPTSTEHVDARDFPHTTADGRRFRLLPLRNTNKRFNPRSSPTLHYPLYGDARSGQVSATAFDGAEEVWPVFGDGTPAVWRWSAALVESRPDDLVARQVNGKLGPRLDVAQRDWFTEDRRRKLPTLWLAQEVGSLDAARLELRALMGDVFETPKPLALLRRILATMPADARVLDFFAGSGTTGHATAALNAEDGGTRRCLSINSAEPTKPGSLAARAGYATISALTAARLERVADSVGGGLEVGDWSAWTRSTT